MTDIGTGTYTDRDPGRGRGARAAARSRAGRARALRLSGQRGLRRLVGRHQHVHRGPSRVRSAAREAAGPRATAFPPEGVEARGRDRARHVGTIRTTRTYSIHTYGAHFAEVGVDADTGEIRLRRMLGVFAAGRILNAKTARSQLIGGMIWGVSSALHEEAVVDTRSGAFVNRDLAEYLVPVHADIPEIDAVLLDGFDDKANVLGAKGIGELGICGAGAAVANAVFNATGVRVRDFPITLEKVLPGLPLVEV